MEHEYLTEENIFLHKNFESRNELFKFINTSLLEKDFTTGDYLEKILERENEHPTGFQLKSINVAMPHVDSEFVLKNGMFVVTSKKGIPFKNAETDEPLLVNIVFGLLLKEANTHIHFLMKLASSFEDDEKLNCILNSDNTSEVKQLLDSILA